MLWIKRLPQLLLLLLPVACGAGRASCQLPFPGGEAAPGSEVWEARPNLPCSELEGIEMYLELILPQPWVISFSFPSFPPPSLQMQFSSSAAHRGHMEASLYPPLSPAFLIDWGNCLAFVFQLRFIKTERVIVDSSWKQRLVLPHWHLSWQTLCIKR